MARDYDPYHTQWVAQRNYDVGGWKVCVDIPGYYPEVCDLSGQWECMYIADIHNERVAKVKSGELSDPSLMTDTSVEFIRPDESAHPALKLWLVRVKGASYGVVKLPLWRLPEHIFSQIEIGSIATASVNLSSPEEDAVIVDIRDVR